MLVGRLAKHQWHDLQQALSNHKNSWTQLDLQDVAIWR